MRQIRIEKKGQANSPTSLSHNPKLHLAALFIMTCLAGGISSAKTSKLYPPSKDQAGALRLTQVMELATRQKILQLEDSRQHLLASGLKDSDFKDGSLAEGRVYCCHPSTDEGTAVWFYVPPDVPVKVGDIVAIRMGHESTKTDPGAVNVAVEVRETQGTPDAKCSWDPPNERLWRRMLYCTWMPAEGWTRTHGAWATWLKRGDSGVHMSTSAFGPRKFDHIQYQTWTKGQKKGDHPLKGSVVFDSNKKAVEFLDEKGDSILIIPTDKITNPMVVDYKAGLLEVDYLLTIRYTDIEGADKSVVITLHKGNLRDVLLAAAAETRKEVFHKDGCCPVF